MGYYVTKKRVGDYINLKQELFHTKDQFQNEVENVVRDLKKYPTENKNQIRFFSGVLNELKQRA